LRLFQNKNNKYVCYDEDDKVVIITCNKRMAILYIRSLIDAEEKRLEAN
tara:strand:+ start:1198 stop:1344 length:147 start_codon:yes stop_codon:yes gene_type:complete